MARTKATAKLVAEICLYGTTWTGAGFLARLADGRMFGTGDPVKDRTFSEAIWHGLDAINKAGERGTVRVFDAGGERMAEFHTNDAVTYGSLRWQPAIVYTISADALIEAAQ